MIANEDAMRWLGRLPDEHADCVCTDPPYGVSMHTTAAKEDRSTPRFSGIANDDAPYIWWLREAWRVTRRGGCLICFAGWQTSDVFRDAIAHAGWRVRSMVIWDKERPALGDFQQDFAPQHEIIWFAVKPAHCRAAGFRFQRCPESGKLDRPRSVLRCKRPKREIQTHPTEKPVDLLTTLIRATVPPGGLVLDPFAGSGSTGEAALRLGRRFAGCELSPDHASNARRRLASLARRPA